MDGPDLPNADGMIWETFGLQTEIFFSVLLQKLDQHYEKLL
jgi:hypothetical protein